jgi:sigma-B regulation protein RsbU (phosphoserine phosphatase)
LNQNQLQHAENELRHEKWKVKSLLQLTQLINNNFSRSQLLHIFETILKNRPSIGRFLLFTLSGNQPKTEFQQGVSKEDLDAAATGNLFSLGNFSNEVIYVPQSDNLFYNLVIPTHHKGKPLALLLVDMHFERYASGKPTEEEKAEAEFLQTLTNVVFVALENKQLARENLQQEILKKEMELASELQAMLFPPDWPTGKGGLELSAFHKTFTDVGGDYYDFFPLSDSETAFCMADVSGKGVSAALLMSNFQGALRTLFRFEQDLGNLTTLLNKQVDSASKGEKFITVFLGKYNRETRKLCYINCGHNPPLLIQNKTHNWLRDGVPGLGMLPELAGTKHTEIDILPDALLVCYTDGITECESNPGEYFGQENLKDIVLNNLTLGPEELNHEIMMKLNSFAGDKNKFQDDAALLTCRFF